MSVGMANQILNNHLAAHPLNSEVHEHATVFVDHKPHIGTEKFLNWQSYLFANPDVEKSVSHHTDAVAQRKAVLAHFQTCGCFENGRSYFVDEHCTNEYSPTIEAARKETFFERFRKSVKPTLLVVSHGLYNRLGGTGTYVWHLCNLLSEKYRIVQMYPWSHSDHHGRVVRVVLEDEWALQIRDDAALVASQLKKFAGPIHGIILNHFLNFDGRQLEMLLRTHLKTVPMATIIHDYYWLCRESPMPNFKFSNPALLIMTASRFLNHSEIIIAPAQAVADVYEKRLPDLAGRISVMGHSNLQFDSEPTDFPAKNDKFTVMCCGKLFWHIKGGERVKRVAAMLPDIHFVILGDMDGLPLVPNLSILGAYREEDMARHISACNPDLLWIPSNYQESYCYCLDHLMESGRPLLLPDLDIFQERTANYNASKRFYDGRTTSSADYDSAQQILTALRERDAISTLHPISITHPCSLQYLDRVAALVPSP